MVAALRRLLPDAPLCYACDNAWLPYGLREDTALNERIIRVCQAAVSACQAAVLVVACNTASTLALGALRQQLCIPVVGTVPAIKPAAQHSHSRHIGLLATSATVTRPYTQCLIDTFASDCQVTSVIGDALVAEAEALIKDDAPSRAVLDRVLDPLWRAARESPRMDTVVLGCTHFPLLLPWLSALAPVPLKWIDSGDAIARRVAAVCQPASAASAVHHEGSAGRSYATAPTPLLGQQLAKHGFQSPIFLAP